MRIKQKFVFFNNELSFLMSETTCETTLDTT